MRLARRDWYCEDILSGKVEVEVVWEDDRALAFHHPRPKAEIHVVVIPKEHISSILDLWRSTASFSHRWSWPSRRRLGSSIWTKRDSTCGPTRRHPASRRTCTGT